MLDDLAGPHAPVPPEARNCFERPSGALPVRTSTKFGASDFFAAHPSASLVLSLNEAIHDTPLLKPERTRS